MPDNVAELSLFKSFESRNLFSSSSSQLPLDAESLLTELSRFDLTLLNEVEKKNWTALVKILKNEINRPRFIKVQAYSKELFRRDLGFESTQDVLQFHRQFDFNQFALSLSLSNDVFNQWKLSDSYFSFSVFDFDFILGRFKQNWGFGNDASLFYSHHAPSMLQSTISYSSSNPLWLLGFWRLRSNFARLDGHEGRVKPYFHGMHILFKPKDYFSFALFRTAMFAGDGRPLTGKLLWNMFIGQDNFYGDGDPRNEGLTRETEPGNQLAGFEFKFNFDLNGFEHSTYAQFAGEDLQVFLPSQYLTLYGIEGFLTRYFYFFERSTTYVDSIRGFSPRQGSAYRNGKYPQGYTHDKRYLGHWAGPDSLIYSFGIFQYPVQEVSSYMVVRHILSGIYFRSGAGGAAQVNTLMTIGGIFNKENVEFDLSITLDRYLLPASSINNQIFDSGGISYFADAKFRYWF